MVEYKVFLNETSIPTPGKIQTKIKNKNKTISLISEREINLLKNPGLSEITFSYVTQKGKTLSSLKQMKKSKQPVRFKVIRPGVYDVDMLVSLESYTIKEDDKHLRDQVVSVTLKEYRERKTAKLDIQSMQKKESVAVVSLQTSRETQKSPVPKEQPQTHTVRKGQTLWAISKYYYGDGAKYVQIAKANGIEDPNFILTGMKIVIPPEVSL